MGSFERGTSAYEADRIRADFDRIAALDLDRADHSDPLYERLLGHVPEKASSAIDLGCGTGSFTRRLAERCSHVVGLDLSERMLERARLRSREGASIDYRQGDLMREPLEAGSYDVVASIATLHHMPMAEALARAASLVRPGGVLLVIDLYQPAGLSWLPDNAISWVWARLHDRGSKQPPALERAWRDHGKHDRYPTMGEVRRMAHRATPGAMVRKHLLWRWTLIWRRPAR